jgi:integral membrane sensor domain MASE1
MTTRILIAWLLMLPLLWAAAMAPFRIEAMGAVLIEFLVVVGLGALLVANSSAHWLRDEAERNGPTGFFDRRWFK